MIQKLALWLGTALLLAACSPNATELPEEIETLNLEDGSYFALEDNFDEAGWKRFVEFSVEEGVLTSLTFDAVNQFAATYKSLVSEEGIEVLDDDTEHLLPWNQQIAVLERYIKDFQSIDHLNLLPDGTTDSLEQVTMTIEPYVELFQQAASQGAVEAGPYLDGRYFADQEVLPLEDSEEAPYRYFLNMIVRGGNIIAVHWNAINAEGVRKYEPVLPGSLLDTEDEAQLWRAQADLVEAYLIATQDPTLMAFDEDAMSQELFGVHIPIQSFIELAVSALGAGPILEPIN